MNWYISRDGGILCGLNVECVGRCVRNCVNSKLKKLNVDHTCKAGVVETSFQFKSSFDVWNLSIILDLKSLLCDELCVLKFEIWILKCDVEVVRPILFFDRSLETVGRKRHLKILLLLLLCMPYLCCLV